jgi:hypothetical protein
LARIRDIRSSEKMFWRKVLDVYATSIDYDPKTEQSLMVFAKTSFPMNEYHEYAPKVHQSSFHRLLLLAGHRSWQSLLSDTL